MLTHLKVSKNANKWEDKKSKNVFSYDDGNEDDLLEDFGFHKDPNESLESSKFSSHVPFSHLLPPKSTLARSDSNAITEENIDYHSNNVSSLSDTERVIDDVEDPEPVEGVEQFLMTASNAELGFLKQSLSNFNEMMNKEKEDQKAMKSSIYAPNSREIEEHDNESDDYKDDFEEIDEEIEVTQDKNSDEDSIEEDLNLDVVEDDDSDEEMEQKMEKFRTEKAKKATTDTGKKRAVSAQYQLQSKSSKPTLPKNNPSVADKSMKSNVLEALKEENKRVGNNDEYEKRMKAETKKSRPFSHISGDKKIASKTRKPQVDTKNIDSMVNYQVDETSSNTDFDRQEKESQPEYPKGSHPSPDAQMRKTAIIQKIEKLSDTQRQQLFFLLEQMEKGEPLEKVDMKFLSPKPVVAKHTKQYNEDHPKMVPERSTKNELRIRVLSTWGHIQVGGLTEIELFEPNGEKILLVPADIIVKNANKII